MRICWKSPRNCAGKFPNLRFLWVGDGLLRQQFEDEMKHMALRSLHPDRHGSAAGVPELTAAMDILVHPSRREGLAAALPQGGLAKSRLSRTTSTATAKA